MRRILREYAVEIIAGLIVLLGVFLVVGQVDMRATITNASQFIVEFVRNIRASASGLEVSSAVSFSTSEIVGFLFIVFAVLFVLWRIRYRFLNSDRWQSVTCPRCGDEIHRIHRSRFDRFIGKIFLPYAGRYECMNEDCYWTGLRRRGRRRKYMEQRYCICK